MLETIFSVNTCLPESYKTSRLVPQIFFVFFALPFIIFAMGWFRLAYSVPIVLVTAASIFFACKNVSKMWIPSFDAKTIVKTVIIVIMVFAWVYISGIGANVFQNYDHGYRNAVYEDLVGKPWPVVDLTQNKMLVYYLAFWLPAALFGKIFGIMAGYQFQIVWSVLFILFTMYFVFTLTKKISILPVLLLFAFSGLDALIIFYHNKGSIGSNHIEWHGKFQFSSFTTQIFYVFNQALPSWAATIFIFAEKHCKSMVFILSLLLLYAPIPFLALIPFAVFIVLYVLPKENGFSLFNFNKIKENSMFIIKDVFTFQNFFGGGFIGIASFLYLSANKSGGVFRIEKYEMKDLPLLIISFALEALIYLVLIRLSGIKHPLYILTGIVLILCPFFKVGFFQDFVMRASIPALFILYVMTVAAIKNADAKRSIISYILVAVIVVGALTPMTEINRTIFKTIELNGKGEPTKAKLENYFSSSNINNQNFIGKISEANFAKFFMKKPKN